MKKRLPVYSAFKLFAEKLFERTVSPWGMRNPNCLGGRVGCVDGSLATLKKN